MIEALADLSELGLTHTRRSEQQLAFDQFSTPAPLAALIVLAAINLLVFTRLERNQAQSFLRWSAGLSLVLWSGVLLCGRFIGFV